MTRPRAPWWRVAAALTATAFGAGTPVPLLLIYRDRLHLPAHELTAVFAVYAIGLIPTLFFSGPLSQRLGRRPLTLAGTGIGGAASVLFLLARHHPSLLFAGRFSQGVASGVVFSVGTVWLGEADRGAATGRNAGRAAAAMSVGFGTGPLAAGLLGQWAPHPLTLPFLIQAALAGGALLLAASVHETADVRASTAVAIGVPAAIRRPFWTMLAPVAPWVFALPTLAIAALPLLVGGRAGDPVAQDGIVTGVTMVTGSVVQTILGRRPARPLVVGLWIGLAGLATSSLAVAVDRRALLIPAGLILGTAYGFLLASGLRVVETLAAEHERAQTTSVFYALAYLGFALPPAITAVADAVGAQPPLATLAAAVTVTIAASTAANRRDRRAHRHGTDGSTAAAPASVRRSTPPSSPLSLSAPLSRPYGSTVPAARSRHPRDLCQDTT